MSLRDTDPLQTTITGRLKQIELLFLSRDDLIDLRLTTEQVFEAVEIALLEHTAGTYEMPPKLGVHPTSMDPANYLHAMPAYLRRLNACGLKWVGGFAKNRLHDLPTFTGLLVYNDVETGIPLAIMEGGYLTALRTAAVSALAAKYCAVSSAKTLAVVGCGVQGKMHLKFLTAAIPSLREVRLRDLREQEAVILQNQAAAYFSGSVTVCTDDQACLDGADIICTCTTGEDQLIRPEWFKPGAFGIAIEGGCAYTAAALHQADLFIVDDAALAESMDHAGRNRLTADGRPDPEFPGGLPPISATIGEVLAGKKPGRITQTQRIVAVSLGMGICDIALAHLVYRIARERAAGSRFRLA